MNRTLIAAIVLFLGSGSTLALADVVNPDAPLLNCPPGSENALTHAGRYCAPRNCTVQNAICGEREECVVQPLCIEEIRAGGWNPNGIVRSAVGVCGPDNRCASGTCERNTVCVPSDPGEDPGLSCQLVHWGSSGMGALASLAVVAWTLGRRRASARK